MKKKIAFGILVLMVILVQPVVFAQGELDQLTNYAEQSQQDLDAAKEYQQQFGAVLKQAGVEEGVGAGWYVVGGVGGIGLIIAIVAVAMHIKKKGKVIKKAGEDIALIAAAETTVRKEVNASASWIRPIRWKVESQLFGIHKAIMEHGLGDLPLTIGGRTITLRNLKDLRNKFRVIKPELGTNKKAIIEWIDKGGRVYVKGVGDIDFDGVGDFFEAITDPDEFEKTLDDWYKLYMKDREAILEHA